jgi:PAS domain
VSPKLMERGLEIMALLREGKSWSGEFPVRRRDGTEIPVLVTDSPLRDADGRLIGVIGVAADLSERKQAERERFERVRLEALLFATEAAQRELSRQLALNLPIAGQLVNDPELPMHLHPIAGVVLNVVRTSPHDSTSRWILLKTSDVAHLVAVIPAPRTQRRTRASRAVSDRVSSIGGVAPR